MGTVIDKSTGLMWQKKTENKKRDWEDAKRFCDELSLGGYSDWRMPALEVMKDMVDEKSDLFSQYKLNSKYWSSSHNCNPGLDTKRRCIVNFFNGYSSKESKKEGMYVRCVRGIK